MARQRYVYDLCIVKKYGGRYKHIRFKTPVKLPRQEFQNSVNSLNSVRDTVQNLTYPEEDVKVTERFRQSLQRTKARVFELAACNEWQFFATLTLSDKWDRHDLPAWHKSFSVWLRNQRRITGCDIRYLILPEAHKDGAWHMHGLFMGLPELREFTLDDFLPYKLLDRIKAGDSLYTWEKYADRYGYNLLEPIRDVDRCATYISKYITKAVEHGVSGVSGAHLYYASQRLQRAEVVLKGYLLEGSQRVDYENDYCSIFWSNAIEWYIEPIKWLPT